ncbi:MAG: DUF2079 domain-containing protein [Candidatus Eremiobacteraeota bacterium]|nr:DUF2079 domain-containing protein [Candidatus Eremiobacteraeota bacterium]
MSTSIAGGKAQKAIVWIGAALFAVLYFALNFNSWWTYDSLDDFGLFMQSMNDPSGMLRNSVEGSHFFVHFSPIYDLFAPLVQFTHSVVPVLVLQSVAGALVGIGTYELAKGRIPEKYAVALACVALLYPPLGGLIYNAPYETCFAPAATVWIFVFAMRRNWTATVLVALLTLGIKEDQGVFLAWDALVAGVFAWRTGDRALLKVSGSLFLVALVVPAAWLIWRNDVQAHWIALNPIFSPVASGVTSPLTSALRRIGFMGEVLVPLGLLPLFSGRWMLFAIPPFLEVLIPPYDSLRDVQAHYSGVWIGYAMIAFVMGAGRVYAAHPRRLRAFVQFSLIAAPAILIFASPLHWRATVHARTPQDAVLDRILADDLPPTGTIGVSNGMFGHLWESRRFELGLANRPCYALVDPTLLPNTQTPMATLVRERRWGRYVRVWEKSGVTLYRRISCETSEAGTSRGSGLRSRRS